MDSLTQLVLGAGIAGAIAPAGQRRKALLAGAVLGTLPDLDVVIDYGDAVSNFTFHRGFSHSLFVLLPFSIVLWAILTRFWDPARAAPRRWLAIITLVLLTHPLLDAHTAYGTQLLWPLTTPPVSWSTLFIIDPLYTLPLLIACLLALFRPMTMGRVLYGALAVSCIYLAWSWIAKWQVESVVDAHLARTGQPEAPYFTTPSPLNTLMWRVVILTDDGYDEGHYSLLADGGQLHLESHAFNRSLIADSNGLWFAQRLRWFAREFVSASDEDGELVYTDLRMGQAPTYVFSHVIAERQGDEWVAIEPTLLDVDLDARELGQVWTRIWNGNQP